MTSTPRSIAFRRLRRSDFPLLEQWLSEPHVLQWWREPLDSAGLEAKYGARIDGLEPTHVFMIEHEDRPVGWIQWYRWSDYELHAGKIGASPDHAGIDLAIGVPDMIGRGLGPRVIRTFLDQVVFADPSVTAVVSDPEASNVRSRRAFEKVGFQTGGAVVLDGEREPRVIVRLNRTGTIAAPMTNRVVTAFAPATVSNVACGFDVLGFPMEEPGDTVSARLIDAPGVLIDDILNDGGRIPRDPEKNTASVAAKAMLDTLGARCGVALTIDKGLPLSSGLGGSAASAAAAVVAVNALVGGTATIDQLVAAALIGEGLGAGGAHPDNIAPAICGGFVLVRHPDPPDIVRLPVPKGLTCVVIHPDLEVETARARALLGTTVPLKDAVQQWANLGALVDALHRSDFDLLARSLEDTIAEPRRAPLVPGLAKIKDAAVDAGALGSSLSGSGPSIFALCRDRATADRVATAMTAAVQREIGGDSQTYVSSISSHGARVIRS